VLGGSEARQRAVAASLCTLALAPRPGAAEAGPSALDLPGLLTLARPDLAGLKTGYLCRRAVKWLLKVGADAARGEELHARAAGDAADGAGGTDAEGGARRDADRGSKGTAGGPEAGSSPLLGCVVALGRLLDPAVSGDTCAPFFADAMALCVRLIRRQVRDRAVSCPRRRSARPRSRWRARLRSH